MYRRIITSLIVVVSSAVSAASDRPNVLFIAIDDLNDWVGCLAGHPDVKTPHIDRLARRGLVFANAHCAALLCRPSRAAVFSGKQPFRTRVFDNSDDLLKGHPDLVLLPQHFRAAGYRTFGTGKLLHQRAPQLFDDSFFPEQRWSPWRRSDVEYTAEELPTKGTSQPKHVTQLNGTEITLPLNGMPSDRNPRSAKGESFDWGPVDVADHAMGDGQITTWAIEKLRTRADQPFFLAVGYYRPHIPLFAPRPYFNLYSRDTISLPPVRDDDLDDVSARAKRWALEAVTAGSHATVVKYQQWHDAVAAYLACVSFVDAQIGRLLAALDASPGADNTIVLLWSDHGWHLGEKQHWGKWTGWERATRIPLVIVPAREEIDRFRVGQTTQPVSLIDVYPTLIDLCQLPPRDALDGVSLVPLLEREFDTERIVVTTFDEGNYSLRSHRWRYLQYADGEEELYDHLTDPQEWHNLAGEQEFDSVVNRLREALRATLGRSSAATGEGCCR